MIIKVVGLENVTFNFEDNKKVSGQYIHYTQQMGQNGLGVKAGKVFISDSKLDTNPEIGLGYEIDLYFNEYRKPEAWRVLKEN